MVDHVVNVVDPLVEFAFKKLISSSEYNTDTEVKHVVLVCAPIL
jgi:hypothetical protein